MKTTELHAADIFDELGPLEEHEQKKFKVEHNPALERIVDGFKELCAFSNDMSRVSRDEVYNRAEVSFSYTGHDIEQFSLVLDRYLTDVHLYMAAGVYLSKLINNCEDESVTVHTHHFEKDLVGLGYYNVKHVMVNGNGGDYLGEFMKRGELIITGNGGDLLGRFMSGGTLCIKGNAKNDVGDTMTDGEITVHGNAGDYPGSNMNGGKIHIYKNAGEAVGLHMQSGYIVIGGNAGEDVGMSMESGLIEVQGSITSLAFNCKGDVFVRGKRITEL